jgi:hypothetical protein
LFKSVFEFTSGRQWPRRTFPGIVTALTGMGFQEYAITMNIYPKRVDKVIEKEEQHT